MDIEQIRAYCLTKSAVTEEFPFNNDTLVFKVLGKMFALLSLKRWEVGAAAINLKADPEYSEVLRTDFSAISPGYHMSKKHWNTVFLNDGTIKPKLIKALIDHSYDMVIKGMPKKKRVQLKAK